ncbi:MAG: Gfo/Idh/MocA family oxidoreductase [Coriobacteriia bacterium]|nr:Gfo/Idh/MocA family oxidoreductase [Coriobacteriia bacterium]
MSVPVPERVCVVGSGSIAQRHVRNLLAMAVSEVVVVTARDVSEVEEFGDPRVRVEPVIPANCPRVAIVANATDLHVATARALVAAGAHVLVEKPAAVGPGDDLNALCAEAEAAGATVLVAYNLRFLGVFRRIAELLEGGTLGRRLFARIEVGQWLPDWRPDRPVTELYSASAERGGGVALDLSHEVDYLYMLFGQPVDWVTRTSHTRILGIDAPDVFDGVYSFDDGFSCTVHMDYLERTPRRRIRLVASAGVIECDIIAGTLAVTAGGSTVIDDDPTLFDARGSYTAELEAFFSAITGQTVEGATLPSLEEAARVLELLADRKAC